MVEGGGRWRWVVVGGRWRCVVVGVVGGGNQFKSVIRAAQPWLKIEVEAEDGKIRMRKIRENLKVQFEK